MPSGRKVYPLMKSITYMNNIKCAIAIMENLIIRGKPYTNKDKILF